MDVVREVDHQLEILEGKLRPSAAKPGKGTQRCNGKYKFVSWGVSAGQGQRVRSIIHLNSHTLMQGSGLSTFVSGRSTMPPYKRSATIRLSDDMSAM